jgi:hypothetical protein
VTVCINVSVFTYTHRETVLTGEVKNEFPVLFSYKFSITYHFTYCLGIFSTVKNRVSIPFQPYGAIFNSLYFKQIHVCGFFPMNLSINILSIIPQLCLDTKLAYIKE